MEELKKLIEEIKEHSERVTEKSESYMYFSRYAEMDIDVQRSIRTIKEAQKLIGMVEVLEVVVDSLSFGKVQEVQRTVMEQLQVLRKAI
jgi:hypothetical protein|nr:MAG TPA: hypothetical protein [Caudoviricetes sp.]